MRRFTSTVLVTLGVAATLLLGSSAAWAHDVVAPATVVAGTKITVTVAVVNEHELPSDGVEMRLPPGFAFRSAEDVPGWRTDLQRRADGTVTAVRWTGGLIESNALAEYVVSGTAPSTAGSLVWAVAQKSVSGKTYAGPPVSATPHMTVTAAPLTDGGGTAASAAPVPLAAKPRAAASTIDGVARSRATLALVLAGLALLGVVAFGSATVRRSQQSASVDQATDPPLDIPAPKAGGSAKAGGKRNRAMSTTGAPRR